MSDRQQASVGTRRFLAFIAGPIFIVLGVVTLITERGFWQPIGRGGMPAGLLVLLFFGLGVACLVWGLISLRARR